MRIEWTAEALGELSAMLEYISRDSPESAALVARRTLKAEKRIISFPKADRFDSETRTYDISIPKTRIVLTYAIRDEVIWIVTAWHTSQNPDNKPKRSA